MFDDSGKAKKGAEAPFVVLPPAAVSDPETGKDLDGFHEHGQRPVFCDDAPPPAGRISSRLISEVGLRLAQVGNLGVDVLHQDLSNAVSLQT